MVATEKENAVGNLLAAYESEINAHARYKAYAAKAESEGLNGAASLPSVYLRAYRLCFSFCSA